jgi:hypothetical protein
MWMSALSRIRDGSAVDARGERRALYYDGRIVRLEPRAWTKADEWLFIIPTFSPH